jgi:hypothetical protein
MHAAEKIHFPMFHYDILQMNKIFSRLCLQYDMTFLNMPMDPEWTSKFASNNGDNRVHYMDSSHEYIKNRILDIISQKIPNISLH